MTFAQMLQRDTGLLTWSADFFATTSGSEGDYGLTAQQVAEFGTTQGKFAAAMAKVGNLGTRSAADVSAKNEAKKTLVNASRMLVEICQAWPQMTAEKRTRLQIPQRGGRPSPAPMPAAAPQASAVLTGPTSARFTARNAADAGRRRRPAGVRQLEIRSMLGSEPTGDPTAWAGTDLSGRTTFDFAWPGVWEATTVWLSCCWINGRNERGPMSPPISVRLAGTGIRPAATAQGGGMKIAA